MHINYKQIEEIAKNKLEQFVCFKRPNKGD